MKNNFKAIFISGYFIECGIIHNEDNDTEKKSVHHHVKHFVQRRCKLRGHSTRVEEIEVLYFSVSHTIFIYF